MSIDRLAEDLYGDARPTSAVTQIHGHISRLRKLLDPDIRVGEEESLLETRSPGYLIRLAKGQLDLHHFERLTRAATDAHARGEQEAAALRLDEALALWRGPALADLADEPFATSVIGRLEDLRLAALEQQIEAKHALGRHAETVGQLEALIAAHPFRERLRGQLMLALYRSGRQAEALDAYKRAREALVEDLGVEPTPTLQRLQHAILEQDPALDPSPQHAGRAAATASVSGPGRAVLVVPSDEIGLDRLLAIAEPLGRLPGKELIVTRLLADADELRPATVALNRRLAMLSLEVRAAVFTSREPAADLLRLAETQDAELVLVDAPADLREEGSVSGDLAILFERSPADVAVLARAVDFQRGDGVFVPFGGGKHDWAALELAALLAFATGAAMRLVGTTADPHRGRRDASRLLAAASLAVQRTVGVETEAVLAEPTEEALVKAIRTATLVVAGCSPRWRRHGIGASRLALIRDSRPPSVFVHRGPRPGGLAPPEGLTRFTWTIEN